MKTTILILLSALLQFANARQSKAFTLELIRDKISIEAMDSIAKDLNRIEQQANSVSIHDVDYNNVYPPISRLKCHDLKRFFYRVIVKDELIERITFKDSTLTIYYMPKFYEFQLMGAVYNLYNEMYKTYFSYDEISSITLMLTDGTNVTFLPTLAGDDFWHPIEGAVMKKKWYIPDIDYAILLGIKAIEAGDCLNKNSEYKSDKIEEKVKEHRAVTLKKR